MRKYLHAIIAFSSITPLCTSWIAPIRAAAPNSFILNEANTVSGDSFLEDDKSDASFGRLQGNGQNWLEFLVVQGDQRSGGGFKDTVDLRGWQLDWSYQKDDVLDKHGAGVMTFSNDPIWAAVPRGTLLTISEWKEAWYLTSTPAGIDPAHAGGLQQVGGINGLGHDRGVPFDQSIHTKVDFSTNTSFRPAKNDWNMNVFAGERNPDGSFKYFSFQGSVTEPDGSDPGFAPDVFAIGQDDDAGIFSVNNDDWRLTIKDRDHNVIEGPIGEHLAPAGIGLNSSEMLKIEDFAVGSNPTQADYLAMTPSSYNDGASSTFGEANVWGSGAFTEDLGALRNWLVKGDFNRDGQVTAADLIAMLKALTDLNKYETDNELTDPLLEAIGDFDDSGTVTNADIQSFLALLASLPDGANSVPEPSTACLCLLAIAGAIPMIRRGRND
jgi:hypothetical protein